MSETTRVPRTWLYGLTADEWLHLASEGTESEITPCCGNIGAIREQLMALSTCQAPYDGWLQASLARELLDLIKADEDGHNLGDRESFPLLHRVLDGIQGQAEQVRP